LGLPPGLCARGETEIQTAPPNRLLKNEIAATFQRPAKEQFP